MKDKTIRGTGKERIMRIVFTIYKPSDTTPRACWNRYFEGTPQQVTIGAAFVAFRRCFSLQWRTP